MILVWGAGLAALAALLPIRLRCRWDCPTVPSEAALYLTGGPWLGLLGLYLRRGPGSWRLGAALAGRPLPGLRLGGASPRPAAMAVQEPAKASRKAWPSGRRTKPERGSLARPLAAPLARFARSVPGTLRLRRLRVHGCWGTADPARTGLFFGAVQAVAPLLPARLDLDLAPDFQRQGFRGQVEVCLWFHLGLALLLLGRLLASIAWVFLRRRWAAHP